MLFTIAIPTYNNAGTLYKAIYSAISQDYNNNYEILVVNNNSTDETLELINMIDDSRLRVVTNSNVLTLFENHNECLRNAKGEYILFCHSDDELDPQALSILDKKISERGYPKKYIVWGQSFFRDFSGAVSNANLSQNAIFSGIVAVRPFLNGGLTPSGTCYSKSFINSGGFLPTNFKLTPSDSSSMIYAALNGFRFEMVGELFFYRRDASTLSRKIKRKDKIIPYFDSYKQLLLKITDDQAFDILMQSNFVRSMNLSFYDFFLDYYPSEVRLLLFKHSVRRVVVMRSLSFWRIFFKTFFQKNKKQN